MNFMNLICAAERWSEEKRVEKWGGLGLVWDNELNLPQFMLSFSPNTPAALTHSLKHPDFNTDLLHLSQFIC